jgi:hypothetical protein
MNETTIPAVGAPRTRSGGIPQKYFLDEQGRQLILLRYDGRRETTTELATRLGVPRRVLQEWARQLGKGRRRGPYRQWTEEEVEYLEGHLHNTELTVMSRHLNRTTADIRWRAKQLGIRQTGEGYTARGLALGFGCDEHKVLLWVEKGWLKGTKRQTDRAEHDIWYFSARAVRSFVLKHPEAVDPWRFDWLWLASVLAARS